MHKLISLSMLRRAATLAMLLALFVVMLGAYTRLTHAGLGCPDWPGCYGHLVLPTAPQALSMAQEAYPAVPIETHKAWTEMLHRYAAGSLVLLIVFLAFSIMRLRQQGLRMPCVLPIVLLCLVAFQAALGMWTVTLKLLPVVVMAHLLGGIGIFTVLTCLRLQLQGIPSLRPINSQWRLWIGLGIVIVVIQIALGGWVSSNYAGLSCMGFPQCNGLWFPSMNWSEGFYLFSPVGVNYQGGVLDMDARMAIQMIHRLGAVITAVYVLSLAAALRFRFQTPLWRFIAYALMGLVSTQVTLGVLNVLWLLPLAIAVAHNGVAALLLATLCSCFYFTKGAVSDGA